MTSSDDIDAAASQDEPDLVTFEPSELGTREYWDKLYQQELEHYHGCGESGEAWFGHACQARLLGWIESNVPRDASILDLGCGNGILLSKLAKAGFKALSGLDYSPNAVEMAQSCLPRECRIFQLDLVDSKERSVVCEHDVVHDKGTFDAVCLAPVDCPERLSTLTAQYKQFVKSALKRTTGLFVITSCNWTKHELLAIFKEFEMVAEIEHKKFAFGSSSGQCVTSLVLSLKQ